VLFNFDVSLLQKKNTYCHVLYKSIKIIRSSVVYLTTIEIAFRSIFRDSLLIDCYVMSSVLDVRLFVTPLLFVYMVNYFQFSFNGVIDLDVLNRISVKCNECLFN
jgi:hypothetical protein